MNRAEFMAALEAQLRDITTEERDEALKFYNEYLDEAGPENEAAVLAELGSPQKVACIIRANCGFGVPAVRDAAEKSTAPEKPEQAPVPELTLDGPDWQASQVPAQETERSWAEGQRADEEAPDGFPNAQAADGAQHGPAYAYSYPQDGAHRENGGRSASNRTLWVILLILTCPIWIGLIGGLVSFAATSDPSSPIGSAIAMFFVMLGSSLLLPFSASFETLMYTDLRIRKENFAAVLAQASAQQQ